MSDSKIYVKIRPDDCPDMIGFRYIWFIAEYIYRVKTSILFNIKHLEFGRLLLFFKNLANIIVHTPSMIDFDYNRTFKHKFDEYIKFKRQS